MSVEQEKELLGFLESLGFSEQLIGQALNEKMAKQEPSFELKCRVPFGKELMFFELYINHDQQFDVYRLEKYRATYREDVPIAHAVLNDVDSKHLETRMAMENWDAYFKGDHSDLNQHDLVYIKETISLLNKLSEGYNLDAIEVKEALMFKFWPADLYDLPSKAVFQDLYERSREFGLTDTGFCNVNLAYFLTSGKLDVLYSELKATGIEEFFGRNLYPVLESRLSQKPRSFELEYGVHTREGYLELTLPVSFETSSFELQDYLLCLTPHPEIAHGFFNGVDTGQLESLMQQMDWKDSTQLYSFDENRIPELIYTAKMIDVMAQIGKLMDDENGAMVAMQLQLKYYTNDDFLNELLDDRVLAYQETLPQKQNGFPAEMEIPVAYNLLCGRAVMNNHVFPFQEQVCWIRLDAAKDYEMIYIDQLPTNELAKLVNSLPVKQLDAALITQNLERGDLTLVTLKDDKQVLLEANPEGTTLNVYTQDGLAIPFNFNFDPHWKVEQKTGQFSEAQSTLSDKAAASVRFNYHYKKAKGKGL